MILCWRIIAAAVCILVIEFVFAFLFMIPLLGLLVHGKGHASLLITSLQLAVGFFASMLFTPLYGIVLTLFYFDARIRKEGYDVEWLLMRSTGTPAQAHL